MDSSDENSSDNEVGQETTEEKDREEGHIDPTLPPTSETSSSERSFRVVCIGSLSTVHKITHTHYQHFTCLEKTQMA